MLKVKQCQMHCTIQNILQVATVVMEEQDRRSTGCCYILVFCFATNSFGTSYEQTVSCINNTLTQLYHKFNKYTKGTA